MNKLDPITREIVGNALVSITREMGLIMQRTAVSPILNEGRDFSCAIFDNKGRLSATAEFVMVHLGAMGASVEAALKEVGTDKFKPGDILLLNDPYRGGSHLPDLTYIRPVFYDGELISFVSNRAHYPDVGGMAPGSASGDASEIVQEGIRIPPILLYKEDKIDKELWDLILSNVRSVKGWQGDADAQVSSLKIGEKRVLELIDKWGKEIFTKTLQELINQSYNLFKSRIKDLPDGEYGFFDYMDEFRRDETIEEGELLKIVVKMMVKNDKLTFDFTGTDKQVKRPINCPIAVTRAAVYTACKCTIVPELIVNAGFFKALDTITEKGSLVDAVWDAPVVGGNTNTSQRLFDIIMGCFAQILPNKVIAAMYSCNNDLCLGGFDKRYNEHFVSYLMPVGGIGARATKDGVDGMINFLGNVSNQPVEVCENVLPFRYLKYKLREDSGGPGKFRGGLGEEVIMEPIFDEDVTLSVFAERVQVIPWGIFGGESAKGAEYVIERANGKKEYINYKTSLMKFKKGDVLKVLTPGGGGYGDPLERDPEKVLEDYIDGKVSLDMAREQYGVEIDKNSVKINEGKTKEKRKEIKELRIRLKIKDIRDINENIIIISEYYNNRFQKCDLVEVFQKIIPLRGWLNFSNNLSKNEIIIPRTIAYCFKTKIGEEVFIRRVRRGLDRKKITINEK